MIHRRLAIGTTLFCLALMSAPEAKAQDVKYNFDNSVDFSKFKTYQWAEITGAQHPNSLVDKQIKEAIDAELAKKGMTKMGPGTQTDVLVAYQTAVQQNKEINTLGGGWGWRGDASATISNINVGTIALDVYTPANKALVWQGTATESLDPSSDPQKNQQRLQKAMDKMLKNYPPPKKK